MFRDRVDAGERLSVALSRWADHPAALILAIPRGGVIVGFQLSVRLRLPLDVFISRKIGAPGNPELALGALAETGFLYLNEGLFTTLWSSGSLEEERRRQVQEIARRQQLYRKGRGLPAVAGRPVILVDDGVATGATYLVAIQALKAARVASLVAALPVAPPDTAQKIRERVGDCIILETPMHFYAVGEHYMDFRQVSDEEVVRCLEQAWGSGRQAKG